MEPLLGLLLHALEGLAGLAELFLTKRLAQGPGRVLLGLGLADALGRVSALLQGLELVAHGLHLAHRLLARVAIARALEVLRDALHVGQELASALVAVLAQATAHLVELLLDPLGLLAVLVDRDLALLRRELALEEVDARDEEHDQDGRDHRRPDPAQLPRRLEADHPGRLQPGHAPRRIVDQSLLQRARGLANGERARDPLVEAQALIDPHRGFELGRAHPPGPDDRGDQGHRRYQGRDQPGRSPEVDDLVHEDRHEHGDRSVEG